MSIKNVLGKEENFLYNKYFIYPVILIFLLLNIFLTLYLRMILAFFLGIYLKLFLEEKLSHDNIFFYIFVISIFIVETIIILFSNLIIMFGVLVLFYIGHKYAKKIKNIF